MLRPPQEYYSYNTLQVDGYKELLLKQRDIMLALTKRLSDRDEQILILQEELDAYDAAQRKLEDALDQRTAEVIAVRKAALEEVCSYRAVSSKCEHVVASISVRNNTMHNVCTRYRFQKWGATQQICREHWVCGAGMGPTCKNAQHS